MTVSHPIAPHTKQLTAMADDLSEFVESPQKPSLRSQDFNHNPPPLKDFLGDSPFMAEPDISTANHWSVAWSDLMMTMFILFLSLFVYRTANQEFLEKTHSEVIGGDTTEALQSSKTDFPFMPLGGKPSAISSSTIKKIEPLMSPVANSTTSRPGTNNSPSTAIEQRTKNTQNNNEARPNTVAILVPDINNNSIQIRADQVPRPSDASLLPEPRPLIPEQPPSPINAFSELYNISSKTVSSDNLEKFAKVDLVPDQTVRIVLTSDLLFALGDSSLSYGARNSLRKLGNAIHDTPYMVNVVGHTDNIPMSSGRFASNWELSVARASTVARFLIEEVDMNPNQFVVSGYAAYRPIVPNTNAANRARNRRVEIIISKRLPSPHSATPENFK